MTERMRLLLLVLIMTVVATVTGGITIYLLYRTAFDQAGQRLVEAARSQARLIESIARHEQGADGDAAGAVEPTLAQLRDAHARYEGFGETGEFTLARRESESIVFLLSHRHDDLSDPRPVSFDSELAEPMRRALRGECGTMVGLDYRGVIVLAAYEPVDVLDLGIVAKIDMTEMRAPFIRAGLIAFGAGVVVVVIGSLLFVGGINPIIRRVQESKRELAAIVDHAADGIMTIDRRGTVKSFNPAADRIFGYAADEVIGENVRMLMPEPYREEHDGYIEAYLSTGIAKVIGLGREVVGLRKDGTRFPIDLIISEIQHHRLFVGMVRDITRRRQTEGQLRNADRLASIGTLAAGLGHDMNNVLLPIRTRLDVLEATVPSEKSAAHIGAIRESITYLQQLNDSLHMLSLDPADIQATGGPTEITAWWEQVAPLLARSLPRRVRLASSMPSDLPPVRVAPHRLTQAALNLLINAGDAVSGDGKVRVWAEPADDPRFVRFGVTDNGAGMTPDVQKHALDAFFTTKKRGLGTGLGLSLVHGIVSSAGGSIEIESEPGGGTTILLVLPVAEGVKTDPARCIERSAAISLGEQRLAALVEMFLKADGFTVSHENPIDTNAAMLWVVEAGRVPTEDVQKFLATPGHQVVVYGSGDSNEHWKELGAITIEECNNFELLRDRIGEAVHALTQQSS